MAGPEPGSVAGSTYTSDPALQPFLQDDFDPAAYLNNTLPTLFVSSGSGRITTANAASLPELNAKTQTLLADLSSQTIRLSNTLTQLTDEIIRSSGRLAYEVELLRGEAIGLTDALEVGMKQDFAVFAEQQNTVNSGRDVDSTLPKTGGQTDNALVYQAETRHPEFLTKLHTLTTARERLDAVVKIFDEAMRWPLAPSEIASASSALLAVSAPSDDETTHSLEKKAREWIEATQHTLEALLIEQQNVGSVTSATKLGHLRDVVDVWKGTAEEKARSRVVDDLKSFVDERQKTIPGSDRSNTTTRADQKQSKLDGHPAAESRYGFLQNLRSLKPEVYLD